MKVLIAAGIFPPETGGPATYAKMLEEQLPKHGIDVTVLPFSRVRIFPNIFRHAAYLFLLLRESREADVIFAQDPVSVGLPARIACKLTGKKFALRVGGDFAWEQGVQRYGVKENLDDFVKKEYNGAVRRLQRVQSLVARGAAVVIVPSEYLKRIVLTWGIDEARIRVIYSAFVPVARTDESREVVRRRLGVNGPTAVSAARLVPWKGMRALISAMKQLPQASLVIAGEGPGRTALETDAQASGVADRVRFLGALPRNELFEYIRAADVFVLNTGYEGMSYQLLEVMSLGTPIITTPVGGNPELIENGKEGVLVAHDDVGALANAISAILARDTSAMTIAAREKVAKFSEERALQETEKTLRDVCAS